MAAAVRNNVWVAPGQDAQLLRKSAAPLTADGLRGEDHGQVLCNTRDAIPGTSSFQDYNLVSDRYFFFFFFSPSASQHHSVYRYLSVWRWKRGCCWSERNSLCYFFLFLFLFFLFYFSFSSEDASRSPGDGPVCFVCHGVRSYRSQHVTDIAPVRLNVMLTLTGVWNRKKAGEGCGDVRGCTSSRKLGRKRCTTAAAAAAAAAAGLQSHWMFLISDMYFQTA